MMKYALFLLTIFLSFYVEAHSPKLAQLLDEINNKYNTASLNFEKNNLKDISKLSYFLQHINKTDTIDSIKLNSYLVGLHQGYKNNDYYAKHFHCSPTPGIIPFVSHNPEFVEETIYEMLEKVAREEPHKFRDNNYKLAFTTSIDEVFRYGLQINNPCGPEYRIPDSIRIPGWSYPSHRNDRFIDKYKINYKYKID
ncbi:hypothetical protein [Vibrio harveyi]|uniref:hypothetical protein n=1 Tax=Vibrio harveyi TaxID=669 RepID=UPI000C7B14F8|nr:hypothetical protein [Vibrio harveyi]